MTDFVNHSERLVAKVDLFAENFRRQQYCGREEFPAKPWSFQGVVAEMTAVVVDSFVSCEGLVPGIDEELQFCQEWRQSLRGQCATRYAHLSDPTRYDVDGLSREDLNRDGKLIALNAIRLGIGIRINRLHSELQRRAAN